MSIKEIVELLDNGNTITPGSSAHDALKQFAKKAVKKTEK